MCNALHINLVIPDNALAIGAGGRCSSAAALFRDVRPEQMYI